MTANKKHSGRLPEHLPPLTDEDGEVRELTPDDFAAARPMAEMFPEIVESFARMRGERGPQKAPVKERVGLRLDRRVLDHFRASGPGWQTRINEVLSAHVERAKK